MKKETRLEKLNKLLGLSGKAAEVTTKSTGRVVGFTEEEIQEAREMQGVWYFLQAPALFSSKTCNHCGEPFLVSRKYVAFCSYTCIRKSLNEQGIEWKKGQDLETLALDPQVWNGNEPLWIRATTLDTIREMVTNFTSTTDTNQTKNSHLSPTNTLSQENSSLSPTPQEVLSSHPPGPTGAGNPTGQSSSKKKKPKAKRAFTIK